MIDTAKLLTIIIEAGAIISTIAGIVAGIIIFRSTKKFQTGILSGAFRSASVGVVLIAFGILADGIQTYLNLSGTPYVSTWLLIFKDALFVIGTYVIVIGVKNAGDKFENLTK
jgi:hypothetical protein